MWKGFSFAAQAHVVKKVSWSCRFGATVGRARAMVILNPREADEVKDSCYDPALSTMNQVANRMRCLSHPV